MTDLNRRAGQPMTSTQGQGIDRSIIKYKLKISIHILYPRPKMYKQYNHTALGEGSK
jgi:hypothetical protein